MDDAGVAIADLETAIASVRVLEPEARFMVSPVGNLAVLDSGGEYVGWIDMSDGATLAWLAGGA